MSSNCYSLLKGLKKTVANAFSKKKYIKSATLNIYEMAQD